MERIPGYTADVQKLGVEIASSIDELLTKVDFVMLETNDGRLHLEQALPILKVIFEKLRLPIGAKIQPGQYKLFLAHQE